MHTINDTFANKIGDKLQKFLHDEELPKYSVNLFEPLIRICKYIYDKFPADQRGRAVEYQRGIIQVKEKFESILTMTQNGKKTKQKSSPFSKAKQTTKQLALLPKFGWAVWVLIRDPINKDNEWYPIISNFIEESTDGAVKKRVYLPVACDAEYWINVALYKYIDIALARIQQEIANKNKEAKKHRTFHHNIYKLFKLRLPGLNVISIVETQITTQKQVIEEKLTVFANSLKEKEPLIERLSPPLVEPKDEEAAQSPQPQSILLKEEPLIINDRYLIIDHQLYYDAQEGPYQVISSLDSKPISPDTATRSETPSQPKQPQKDTLPQLPAHHSDKTILAALRGQTPPPEEFYASPASTGLPSPFRKRRKSRTAAPKEDEYKPQTHKTKQAKNPHATTVLARGARIPWKLTVWGIKLPYRSTKAAARQAKRGAQRAAKKMRN